MKIAGYSILFVPPLLWSSMLVVGSAVLGEVRPATLTFWTWLIATLSLLPFTLRSLTAKSAVVRKELMILFVLALLGVSGFQFLLFSGLVRASAISAAVLSPTIPIMVACLGMILLKERLRLLQIFGVMVSFVGAAWIGAAGDWAGLSRLEFGTGESLIVAANLCIAGYTIMLKRYPSALSPLDFMTVIAALGTLQSLPASLLETQFRTGLTQALAHPVAFLYIGIVNYSLAYVFWNMAVKRHGATVTAVFLYLIPIFGTLLSIIFLKEKLFLYHYIGISFICVGLYFALHTTEYQSIDH